MDMIIHEEIALDATQRISLLKELLTCGNQICSWVYSTDLHLMHTNSTQLVLHTVFEHTGCLSYLAGHFKESGRPLILSSHLGIMWCAACEDSSSGDAQGKKYHVIGPVLSGEVSKEALQKACKIYPIPISWKKNFLELMQNLPVVSAPQFFQACVMLHYCATGEKLSHAEISFQQTEQFKGDTDVTKANQKAQKDRFKTYYAEQNILRNIREGNLNYARSLEEGGKLSSGIRISTHDPVNQAILSCACFVTLCTRAAIDGGMSPDAAYSLGDSYIQSLIGCTNITDIRSINHTMYEDFIRRVHHLQSNPSYSKQIQSCIDYIRMHPEDELSLKHLAHRVGYVEYYLSNKFRQETGSPLKDYIRNVRIERAKALLTTTQLPVSDIAQKLHFCSGSYFSESFRKCVGVLPAVYRRQNQKL